MHREPPAQFVLWALGYSLELGILFDPATSSAIIEELKRTVTKWRGSYELLRVVWIGWLPTNISLTALANFRSRVGYIVEVRTCTCLQPSISINYS